MLNADSVMFVFPDPRLARSDGLLCVGGNLALSTLQAAYRLGIFPWPHRDWPLLWFSPDPRAILDFDKIHCSRSLKKILRKHPYRLTRNQAFSQVIGTCASIKRSTPGTWIRPDMIAAYQAWHRAGGVLSVEVWQGSDLVGGIYGVLSENYFSAESMFHRESNASKIALIELISWLKDLGHHWMDIQMLTPTLEQLGAEEIPRDEFLARIGYFDHST